MSSPDVPDISVREAGLSDAARLETLARRIWTPHYAPIIGAAQVQYMLDSFQSEAAIRRDMESGYIYEIACLGGEPCGYSAVRSDSAALFLSKLYVGANCRGRGIARLLVSRAEERARQSGASCIRLTCNKRNDGSLAAYARFGFQITGECVTPIGCGFVMDDFILEKAL